MKLADRAFFYGDSKLRTVTDLAYAVTGHKGMGGTVRGGSALVTGREPREWLYVAITRGTEDNIVVAVTHEGAKDKDGVKVAIQPKETDPDPGLIQTVYDGLISLGYQPVAPSVRKFGRKPEQYLRWIADGEGPTRAYLNTASLGFSRRDDMAKVAGLPGAEGRADFVKFSILTPEGVEQALAAARAVL